MGPPAAVPAPFHIRSACDDFFRAAQCRHSEGLAVEAGQGNFRFGGWGEWIWAGGAVFLAVFVTFAWVTK
jgi:hypothetical protein